MLKVKKEDGTWGLVSGSPDLMAILNMIYPIGSYAFGNTAPTLGTWVEVTGDRALWLKSSAADGATISQGLPNIAGNASAIVLTNAAGSSTLSVHNGALVDSLAYPSHAGNSTTSSGWWSEGKITFDASDSNSIYGASSNVQPNAYVMKVWKRTA